MTDIVERLRAEWVADVNSCPQCGADDTDQTDGLMREAADEIERLRKRIVELDGFVKDGNEQQVAVENENGRLRAAIFDWARDISAAEGVLFLRGSEWETMIMGLLDEEAARRGGWEDWR